jgi:hypothetical protein
MRFNTKSLTPSVNGFLLDADHKSFIETYWILNLREIF